MQNFQGKFITSAASKSQFLKPEKPLIAVCGKSNVGKSSFINALANNKKLAKVSKEPGRTRLVNYFDFGGFVLADLPGYGFARVSKGEKEKWANLLEDFFKEEKTAHVFALTDIRREPTPDDLQMAEYLYYYAIPFTVTATKADKLSRAQTARILLKIAAAYKCGTGNVICCSSQTRSGFDKICEIIDKTIELFN